LLTLHDAGHARPVVAHRRAGRHRDRASLAHRAARHREGTATEIARQLAYAGVDVVPNGAHLVYGFAIRIGEIPVDVFLPWDVRTLIATPHRHHHIRPLAKIVGQFLWPSQRQVDAPLAHHVDDNRVDVLRRSRARRASLVAAVGGTLEEGLTHLRPARILLTNE